MQTEQQARRHILSENISDSDVMAVLQAMSDSRQHRTTAASLTSWFQKQPLQADAQRTCAATRPLCSSDPSQEQVKLRRAANAVCDSAAPFHRRNSSDVSAVSACLGPAAFHQNAVASDVAQLDDKQGSSHVHHNTGMLGPALVPEAPGMDRAAASQTLGTILEDGTHARESEPCGADAGVPAADWMGASAHATSPKLHDVENMFEGLDPLDGLLEDLGDGIDVRNLWAGGDALEASSDCTMSEELTFVDSESVTGAILDCFKDPIWRLHEPPDDVPFTCPAAAPDASRLTLQPLPSAVAAVVDVGAVRHCYQENAVDFLLDAVDPVEDCPPCASWKDPDYTPRALQVSEKPPRAQRKGTAKHASGAYNSYFSFRRLCVEWDICQFPCCCGKTKLGTL